jgi:L-ascorbate metabolism protein UlaG (beta-lactamase superfamily)
VHVTVGDLTIQSLASTGGNATDIPAPNTIFVFRTEGLCLVHLGNLRETLNEAQRQRLGRPDVLMMPIDGHWTLTYEQIAATVTQLRPAIVLPMHYDSPTHARLFMQFMQGMVPVRAIRATLLPLVRTALPGASEVIVLGYPEGER